MKVAPRARGPTSANLQGRKPREVGRGGASDAMGISVLHRSVDRLFGKRSMARRVCFVDRDRQNQRRAAEIDQQGGCPWRREGEHGHCWSRAGEAEVHHWNVSAN